MHLFFDIEREKLTNEHGAIKSDHLSVFVKMGINIGQKASNLIQVTFHRIILHPSPFPSASIQVHQTLKRHRIKLVAIKFQSR